MGKNKDTRDTLAYLFFDGWEQYDLNDWLFSFLMIVLFPLLYIVFGMERFMCSRRIKVKEYFWVVGGGIFQTPLAEEASRRGLKLIISDKNPNCTLRRMADKFIQLDTRHPNNNFDWGILDRIAGVATAGTDVGPTVSHIAKRAGLRACDESTAHAIQNKRIFRERMQAYTPWFRTIPWDVLKHGLIVKATNNWASRGMTILDEKSDFIKALKYARSETVGDYCSLLEERLDIIQEGSTDWFIWNKYPYFLNGDYRYFSKIDSRIELGWWNPWIPPQEVYDLAAIVCAKFPDLEGPFKMDVAEFAPGRWAILEACTRWSGMFGHSLALKNSTGIDLMPLLVDYALNKTISVESTTEKDIKRYTAGYTPRLFPGIIITEDDVLSIRAAKNVIGVYRLQDVSKPIESCADRPLLILAEGDTPQEAFDNAHESVHDVEVYYRSQGAPWREE